MKTRLGTLSLFCAMSLALTVGGPPAWAGDKSEKVAQGLQKLVDDVEKESTKIDEAAPTVSQQLRDAEDKADKAYKKLTELKLDNAPKADIDAASKEYHAADDAANKIADDASKSEKKITAGGPSQIYHYRRADRRIVLADLYNSLAAYNAMMLTGGIKQTDAGKKAAKAAEKLLKDYFTFSDSGQRRPSEGENVNAAPPTSNVSHAPTIPIAQVSTDDGHAFSGGPMIGVGQHRLPKFSFIGFENPSSHQQLWGVEGLQRTDTTATYALNFTLGLGGVRNPSYAPGSGGNLGYSDNILFGLAASSVNFRGALSQVDPLGDNLELPGTGDPNALHKFGFSVSPGPFPFTANVVTNAFYNYKADTISAYDKFARTWTCDVGSLTGYGGVGYTYLDQRQRYGGEIPGYGSNFLYDTKAQNNVIRLIAGARGDVPIAAWPGLSANAGVTGFVNFNNIRGRDAFDVMGPIPTFQTSQWINVRNNDTTAGFMLSTGINYEVRPGITIDASVLYLNDAITPKFNRNGNDPTRLSIGRSEDLMGVVGAKIRF